MSSPISSPPTSFFFTNEAVALRWDCSTETVRRTARRERWTSYRMGGRVIRFPVEEVLAYEARCCQVAPRHATVPPKRHNTSQS